MPESILNVSDLKTHFHTEEGLIPAVDGVTFSVSKGKTLAIVGESGCGKSVTAYSLLRLIQAPGKIVGGQIKLKIDDELTVDIAELREKSDLLYHVRGGVISMIFQEPMTALSPVHTVGNQVCEAILTHNEVSPEEAEKQAVDMLRRVGIPGPEKRLKQYPFEFSGGMRQRVMIAMALVCKPKLLIADEPTTALDVTVQAQILKLIKDLQAEMETSVLLITHDLGVVAQTADDVAVMYLGRIVEQGPVREVLKNPRHPYTMGLLDSLPSINARAERLRAITGSVPSLTQIPAGCPFHPRCPYAVGGVCDVGHRPDLTELGPGRVVACVRAEEITREQPVRAKPAIQSENPLPSEVKETENGDKAPVQPLLSVRNLCKHFPIRSKGLLKRQVATVRAVQDLSFDLYPGETLGIVGESGSGKTTAARTILRAIDPTAGQILFHRDGHTVDLATQSAKELKGLRTRMQMIFQDPFSSLNPRMTVGDIIGEPLRIHGLAEGDELKSRVETVLARVGLKPEHRVRYPHAFSGGQRQRIGIARALIMNPDLIIADEAVSALDVSVQAQVINLLEDLQEEFNLTYIFVAHDLSVIRHICDRIVVMYGGKVVEIAETETLFARPRHPYTQSLLAAIPHPDPDTPLAYNISGEVADPSALPPGCSFDPRCPHAKAGLCDIAGKPPPLQNLAPNHQAACVRLEESYRI
ncbi:MAG: ABC transporter ATP-binding protein [Kiritimatiellae bacterium]|nr:ABC transporter ATP-binding protein [Kiritimatiellia bacterium]